MAKSKHGPALFELITDGQEGKELGRCSPPKWWKSAGTADSKDAIPAPEPESVSTTTADAPRKPVGSPAQETTPARIQVPTAPAPLPTPLTPSPTAAPPAAAEPPEPTLDQEMTVPPIARLRDGRVELSLNVVSASVVVGVLLLTLFTSYQLGQLTAPEPTNARTPAGTVEDELAAALKGPAHPEVLKVRPNAKKARVKAERSSNASSLVNLANARVTIPNPAAAALAAKGSVQRQSGLNYIVIESFEIDDLDDAMHAQKWLADEHKLLTTMQQGKTRWRLISAAGYDYGKPAEKTKCEEQVAHIKRLGQTYRTEFRNKRTVRYDFGYPYPKKEP